LKGNFLMRTGIQKIIKALESNHSITEMTVGKNATDDDLDDIDDILDRNFDEKKGQK
jgi:hypothetical protein